MGAMVRTQSVRGYRQLVAELGGDARRLLRAAKIKSAAFDQPASFVTFDAIIQLLERSAHDLACPDFGLRLAERQDIGILGPLAVGDAPLGHCRRRDALRFALHLRVQRRHRFSVQADNGDDQAIFAFEILDDHGPHCAQMTEHGVGITCRILSMLSAGMSRPNRVWLPHPPLRSRAAYRRHWVPPVEFKAPRAALAIDRRDLDLPLRERNEELRALAVDYLTVNFAARRTSLSIQVRNVIERLLGTGACGYVEAADAALHAPPHPATATPGRGHNVRRDQGRSPTGSGPAIPGLPGSAPPPGDSPARLQRTVGTHQKLPALVPCDSQLAPGQSRLRHFGHRVGRLASSCRQRTKRFASLEDVGRYETGEWL